MTHARSALRNWCEDALVAGALGAVRSLPASWVLGGARGLARVAFLVMRERREHTLQLVGRRLGIDAAGPEARRIVLGAFQALALNAVEFLLVERALARGAPDERFVTVEGGEHLRAAIDAGHGVLLCTGHIGAWELSPLFAGRLFVPIWVMARTLDNPRLERRLAALRLRFSRGAVNKDGGGLKLARILRAGETVGLLLDQNAGRGGQIMDFLGAPASQHMVAGVMARRFGARAVPAFLLREPGRLRFRLVFEPPIVADPALEPEAAERDVVQRVSDSMAAQVRRHPEQWLWLHDRWRHAERVLRLEQERQEKQELERARERARDTTRPVAQGTNGG